MFRKEVDAVSNRRRATAADVRFVPDDNGTWYVEVVGEPRIHSHGRTIEAAEENIKEALALWYERPEGDFEIIPLFDFPKRLRLLVERTRELRLSASRIEKELAEKSERAVDELSARGISRRDASRLLGISHQRVQQLLDRS